MHSSRLRAAFALGRTTHGDNDHGWRANGFTGLAAGEACGSLGGVERGGYGGGGALASDEALAALREKLSGGQE